MTRSRDFFENSVYPRIRKNPGFRLALLDGCREDLLSGDLPTAKSMLTHYLTATLGFEEFAAAMGCTPDDIRRTLDPDGDAPGETVLEIIDALRKHGSAHVSVTT